MALPAPGAAISVFGVVNSANISAVLSVRVATSETPRLSFARTDAPLSPLEIVI
jgi:hypothetical protein